MSRRTFILAHEQARRNALDCVRSAPAGFSVVVQEGRRNLTENAHFHAQIGAFAEQDNLNGRKLPAESWKRLLINAFRHDTKDDPELKDEWLKFGEELELLPALNHAGFVAVGDQSRRFTSKLARAFSAWLYAYGVERGITWSEPE